MKDSKLGITFASSAVAGGIAGGLTRLVTAPLDVIKIRFQLQQSERPRYLSMCGAFRSIVRTEGLLALWHGNLCATYLWVSYSMAQFMAYDALKAHFNGGLNAPRTGPAEAASAFVLGSTSAAAAVAVSYPFDLMRTQFVVQGRGDQQLFSSIAAFAQHTQRTKGLPGFFAGLPAAVVGIVPSMGINFAVYEMLLRAVRKHRDELTVSSDRMGPGAAAGSESSIYHTVRAVVLTNGACGAVSGGVSKLLVYPLDTVKKLLQLEVVQCSFQRAHGEHTSQAYQRAPKYHSLGECVAWVYKHEGLSGYYKGVVPSLWKSVLSTGVMFASYQTIKEHLDTVL